MKYRVFKNESGQTVVEYILVLTVVVVLTIGVVYQLNSNFSNYMRNYIGNYIVCLLETGELPKLGADADPNSECDDDYEPFSIAFGRPGVPDSGGDASDNRNSARSSSSERDRNTDGVSEAGSASEGGGNTSGRRSSFSQPYGGSASSSSLRPQNQNVDANSNDDKVNDDEGGTSTVTTRRGSRPGSRKRAGFSDEEEGRPQYLTATRLADEEDISGESLAATSDGDLSGGLRKKTIEQDLSPPKREIASEDSEMDFGNFIRYLIMAAIAIALILFLLGQFLQIQKSMEK